MRRLSMFAAAAASVLMAAPAYAAPTPAPGPSDRVAHRAAASPTVPSIGALSAGNALAVSFTAASIAAGATTTLSVEVTNLTGTTPPPVNFTLTLPAGLEFDSLAGSQDCYVGSVAVGSTTQLTATNLAAVAPCYVTATVKGVTAGSYTVGSSDLTATQNVAGITGGSLTVTAPAPSAPAAPTQITATAGTSSIKAEWTAPVGGSITGYTVTAHPGPATCTTTGATSCVLGATAGVTYTLTVTATSASGTSEPSAASNPVTPAAPAPPATPPATDLVLTTDQGNITTAEPGQRIVFVGTGFAAHSTVTISLYSTAKALGTAVTDGSGAFSQPITVPAGVAAGSHTVLAQGVAPDGTTRAMRLAVRVGAGRLAVTGPPGWLLVLFGGLLSAAGVLLYRMGSRAKSAPRSRAAAAAR